MGCHTWAYKVDKRPYEEVKTKFIKNKLEIIDFTNKKREYLIKTYDKYTDEAINAKNLLWKRQIEIAKKGLCQLAIRANTESLCTIHNGICYVDCGEFHDMFRIYGYPDDILHNYNETLDFIKNYEFKKNQKVTLEINKETDKTYLEEFWEKYPDGIIKFG